MIEKRAFSGLFRTHFWFISGPLLLSSNRCNDLHFRPFWTSILWSSLKSCLTIQPIHRFYVLQNINEKNGFYESSWLVCHGQRWLIFDLVDDLRRSHQFWETFVRVFVCFVRAPIKATFFRLMGISWSAKELLVETNQATWRPL